MKMRIVPAVAAVLLLAAPSQALDLSFTTFTLESGGGNPVSTWRYDDIAPG
jgi:hypothetical protein